ncbi:PaaI family thioesterase [Parasphingopyxis marina]|uniref:PaaI family thioesterase n=1 Tax=Parasphingopyxis marina TaxID=2761622 RepID=A0A842I2H4_9SPHN|nr:PaaI family thioesterase [Parasphingopyxis marina]MBC2778470.1 PaaI family thioesterase [Parasphingopyxis marina]
MTLVLPPYAKALGLVAEVDDAGRLILSMEYGQHVMGRPGFLHGGAIAGLLEIAAIASVRHQLAEDDSPQIKPITVTTDFMRGGREQLTYATGVISRLGKRLANVESFAWQDDETKPIAAARMNLLLARK